jgi:hypothetical protein
VQLQQQSSELNYASQQLEWSSGKAERLIAQILQIIDSRRLLLLSAPKVRMNRFKCNKPTAFTKFSDLSAARQQTGLFGRLPCDKGRPASSATILGIVVRKHHAFLGDPINVRHLVPDDPKGVRAEVRLPYVVSKND